MTSKAGVMRGFDGLCRMDGTNVLRAGTVGLWSQGYVGMPLELWEAAGGREEAKGQTVQVAVDVGKKLLALLPLDGARLSRRDGAYPRATIRTASGGRLVMVYAYRALEAMGIDPLAAAGRYVAGWSPVWGLVLDLGSPLWLADEVPGHGRGMPYEVNVERRRVRGGRGIEKVRPMAGRGMVNLAAWREEHAAELGELEVEGLVRLRPPRRVGAGVRLT